MGLLGFLGINIWSCQALSIGIIDPSNSVFYIEHELFLYQRVVIQVMLNNILQVTIVNYITLQYCPLQT